MVNPDPRYSYSEKVSYATGYNAALKGIDEYLENASSAYKTGHADGKASLKPE